MLKYGYKYFLWEREELVFFLWVREGFLEDMRFEWVLKEMEEFNK